MEYGAVDSVSKAAFQAAQRFLVTPAFSSFALVVGLSLRVVPDLGDRHDM